MGAMILKCHKCGRNYAVNNIKDTDIHRCECGSALTWKDNYIGSCETADMPNEPHRKKECESGWVWWKQRTESGKLGFAFVDKNNKVNVVPIISIGTKALVFQTDAKLTVWAKMAFEREYTQRLGIDCVLIDGGNKLVAVIDG